MKLKNLGKVYTLDSDDNFDLQKDITLSEDVMNFVNIILDYFREVICSDIHSAYLRGSCLERNVVDNDTMDIDMIIVHEDESFDSWGYLTDECIDDIIEIMESTYGFSIYPDIGVHYIDHFRKSTQMRFLCKKVYGQEDLSISKIKRSEMFKWIYKNQEGWIDQCKIYVEKEKKRFDLNWIRSAVKYFFRNFSIEFLVENGQYTKSLYKCYNVMLENYPNHRNDLEDIMDLFLHCEEYSKEKIVEDLDKIISFLETDQPKKTYRIKINRGR